jgi:hypothetical protein
VAQLVAGDEAGEVGGDGAVAAGWEEVTGRLTSADHFKNMLWVLRFYKLCAMSHYVYYCVKKKTCFLMFRSISFAWHSLLVVSI